MRAKPTSTSIVPQQMVHARLADVRMRREQAKHSGKRDVTLANVDDDRAVVSGVDHTTSGRAGKIGSDGAHG